MSDNNKQIAIVAGTKSNDISAELAKYLAAPRSLSIADNEVINNTVYGSMNFGTTHIELPKYEIKLNPEGLAKLIENHNRLKDDDPMYLLVLDELQSRIRDEESRPVIGLAAKLNDANRSQYLDEARIANQKAAKMIAKYEGFRSYQAIFYHVLGLILTRFNHHVLPLIRTGASDIEIKHTINSVIIEPLHQEVLQAGGILSSEIIDGMIYFLTDKCHVEWK